MQWYWGYGGRDMGKWSIMRISGQYGTGLYWLYGDGGNAGNYSARTGFPIKHQGYILDLVSEFSCVFASQQRHIWGSRLQCLFMIGIKLTERRPERKWAMETSGSFYRMKPRNTGISSGSMASKLYVREEAWIILLFRGKARIHEYLSEGSFVDISRYWPEFGSITQLQFGVPGIVYSLSQSLRILSFATTLPQTPYGCYVAAFPNLL